VYAFAAALIAHTAVTSPAIAPANTPAAVWFLSTQSTIFKPASASSVIAGSSFAPNSSCNSPNAILSFFCLPSAVPAASVAAPLYVLARSRVISSKDRVFPAASFVATPSRDKPPTDPFWARTNAIVTASNDLPDPADTSIANDAKSWAFATSPVAATSFPIAGRNSSSATAFARPCAAIHFSVAAICSFDAPAALRNVFANFDACAASSAAACVNFTAAPAAKTRPPASSFPAIPPAFCNFDDERSAPSPTSFNALDADLSSPNSRSFKVASAATSHRPSRCLRISSR